MMQLEFPFTRNGALLRYVTAETKYIKELYKEYTSKAFGSNYVMPLNSFIEQYVLTGGAKRYGERHSQEYFKDVVEKENGLVLRKWNDNNLFPNWRGLESKLNGDIPHNR